MVTMLIWIAMVNCFGDAIIDECGVCGGDGIPDDACDCEGNIEACSMELALLDGAKLN